MSRLIRWILIAASLLISGLSAQGLLGEKEPDAQAIPIALAHAARPSVVVIEQWTTDSTPRRRGIFTGVFVAAPKSELPWILTVIHEVSESDNFRIAVGRTITKAKLVGYDEDTKLTLLEMDHASERPVVSFAKSSPVSENAPLPIFMVEGGSPGNEPATPGLFACREPLKPLSTTLLRINIAGHDGCGGAPIYDGDQQLVGLVSAPVAGVPECFHALPAERIAKFLRDIRKHGKPVDPWLGIVVDERIPAAQILGRTANSPAQKCGLERNDLILSVGATRIMNLQNLMDAFSLLDTDVEVEIKVLRGREVKTLKITPRVKSAFSA